MQEKTAANKFADSKMPRAQGRNLVTASLHIFNRYNGDASLPRVNGVLERAVADLNYGFADVFPQSAVMYLLTRSSLPCDHFYFWYYPYETLLCTAEQH